MDSLTESFAKLARDLDKIDRDVYATHGKDPLLPIIGEGAIDAPICIFGRDPGREEVKHGLPFIGAGGQKVRNELYRAKHGKDLPHFEASVQIGDQAFWANTVPYKPIGNKAWGERVKQRFHPLMAQLILTRWHGHNILTLGREAFLWFGIGRDRVARTELDTFWRQPDRFTSSLKWTLSAPGIPPRDIVLHPLPHPSPLNATWYKHFPELLASRLQKLLHKA